jgi:hypothetical protein
MKFENIIRKFTKLGLIWQQKKNIASLGILENYLTDAVTKGEKIRSNQLIDVQNKLDESKKFLKFLKEI